MQRIIILALIVISPRAKSNSIRGSSQNSFEAANLSTFTYFFLCLSNFIVRWEKNSFKMFWWSLLVKWQKKFVFYDTFWLSTYFYEKECANVTITVAVFLYKFAGPSWFHWIFVCACICACVKERRRKRGPCVCVCERERESGCPKVKIWPRWAFQ